MKHHRWIYTGLNESGKTTLVIHHLKGEKAAIWDPNDEYPSGLRWVPQTVDRDEYEEFNKFCLTKVKGPCFVVTDEAHQVLPSRQQVAGQYPYTFQMLTKGRHPPLKAHQCWVTLRPAMIHTDTWELADRYYIFECHGAANIDRLNNMVDGMGDEAQALQRYYYIECDGNSYKVKPPVKL